jgi:hypothetical protein
LDLILAFLFVNGLTFGWLAFGFWRDERRHNKNKHD